MRLSPRSFRVQPNWRESEVGRYANMYVYSATLVLLLAFLLHAAFGGSKKADQRGIHKIKHIIIIMQENRSFDSYFGTYSGADGIPMEGGVPTVCNPDPKNGGCVKPYHDAQDENGGGPHGEEASIAAIDGGKMDGFLAQAESGKKGCLAGSSPVCTNSSLQDAMGYHDEREIPIIGRMREPSCSRITCSSRTLRGACPSTCSKSPPGRRSVHSMITLKAARTSSRRPGYLPIFVLGQWLFLEAKLETALLARGQSTLGPTSLIFCTNIT